MQSADLTRTNIAKLAKLFPNVIAEVRDDHGQVKKVVDFDLLKQELADFLVEGEKERYQLTWPGKKLAILQANQPIDRTLRPVIADSVNWDDTQNLYIEGDNLEVLKLLQESYLNKIKLIYIDPPYNTGKDFIYKDNFRESPSQYQEKSGEVDEEGNQLVQNNESNGRFHSDWLTMMYARLRLAKNLLSEDGVLVISIDDHEVANLRKLCEESALFGKANYAGCIIVKSNPRGSQSVEHLAYLHEYLLIYCKDIHSAQIIGHALTEEMADEYKYEDEAGKFRYLGLRQRGGFWRKVDRPLLHYAIYVNPDNGNVSLEKDENYSIEVLPFQPTTGEAGTWRWGKDKFQRESHLLVAKTVSRDGSLEWDVFQKDYLNSGDDVRRTKAKSIWDEKALNYQNGSTEVKGLFDGKMLFDYPKPVYLLRRIFEMINLEDDIILDFFSGSSTTAHAVMQMNAEDNGKRKFIMVQLAETTHETSEAYKAGFENICEIGKERIRRAAMQIKQATGAEIDYGFRVYRVDSTNMKDVYYTADQITQQDLLNLASNIKEDRTGEDLLVQVMLELGLPLSLPMESKQIGEYTVYYVAGNSLIACFHVNVPESLIKQIAMENPLRVVFRDSSFQDDSARINVEELFKSLSPGTEIQVL